MIGPLHLPLRERLLSDAGLPIASRPRAKKASGTTSTRAERDSSKAPARMGLDVRKLLRLARQAFRSGDIREHWLKRSSSRLSCEQCPPIRSSEHRMKPETRTTIRRRIFSSSYLLSLAKVKFI